MGRTALEREGLYAAVRRRHTGRGAAGLCAGKLEFAQAGESTSLGKQRWVRDSPASWNLPKLANLEPNVVYQGLLFNPSTGRETELGQIKADDHGKWQPPD